MDQASLVMPQIDAADQFLRHLQGFGFPMTAAAWIKEPDLRDWYLFIASAKVEDVGLRDAYSVLLDVFHQFPPTLWLDRFRIRLIGSTNPIANDLLAVRAKYPLPAVSPIRFYGPRLGDLSVEGAYLYPSLPIPAAAGS